MHAFLHPFARTPSFSTRFLHPSGIGPNPCRVRLRPGSAFPHPSATPKRFGPSCTTCAGLFRARGGAGGAGGATGSGAAKWPGTDSGRGRGERDVWPLGVMRGQCPVPCIWYLITYILVVDSIKGAMQVAKSLRFGSPMSLAS